MEEARDAGAAAAADPPRRLEQGTVGEQAQEVDGVEEVRFADAVGSGDAGEGAEPHVDVDEVLEARDAEPGQHDETV